MRLSPFLLIFLFIKNDRIYVSFFIITLFIVLVNKKRDFITFFAYNFVITSRFSKGLFLFTKRNGPFEKTEPLRPGPNGSYIFTTNLSNFELIYFSSFSINISGSISFFATISNPFSQLAVSLGFSISGMAWLTTS